MPNTAAIRDDRRVSNPIFNQRKIKLGTFQSNLDYGCLMSDVEGRIQISWAQLRSPSSPTRWNSKLCSQ
jgi:hypothetical protein